MKLKRKKDRPKWQQALTRDEVKHLLETTSTGTLQQFKINAEFQARQRAAGRPEPCWTCKLIARKLGVPV